MDETIRRNLDTQHRRLGQIAAATELARAKGGRIDDISRLGAGQFYLASEGTGFQHIRVPQYLSHHPPSPPNEEEVVAKAARGLEQ